MVVTKEICKVCSKGYLVEEVSSLESKPLLYCNNCFKYKGSKEDASFVGINHSYIGLNDDEIKKFLNDIFKED